MRHTALLLPFLLAACGSQTKLSDEGRQVRVINTSMTTPCTHMGMVIGSGAALEGGLPAAQVKMRNRIAGNGGNAVVLTSQTVDGYGNAQVMGDAYRCP